MSSNTITDGLGGAAANLIESHGEGLTKTESNYLISTKQWPNVWGECVSALLLQRALAKHADALNLAASASDRHAKSLVWATWALFCATLALVLVGIIQLYK